jgi:hypothetical protein
MSTMKRLIYYNAKLLLHGDKDTKRPRPGSNKLQCLRSTTNNEMHRMKRSFNEGVSGVFKRKQRTSFYRLRENRGYSWNIDVKYLFGFCLLYM